MRSDQSTVQPVSRLLTAREAADYFKLPVAQFERLRVGRACFGTKVRYDRHALDTYLDAITGLAHATPTSPINDAESALDRFTARFANPARRP